MASLSHEISFGIIPVHRHKGEWQVLLVQHRQGHWSFPKGRCEVGEEPQSCAVRELMEETSLQIVQFLSDHTFSEHYELMRNGELKTKTVTYYVAEVQGNPIPQLSELQTCQWVSIADARQMITFPAARQILENLVDSGLLG